MSDVKKIGSAGIPLNIVDANGRKIMGDAYDNTATYAVGDYCISGDHAYKCTTEIETPEDFNTNHWQQITIEEILKEHDGSIESINASLTQNYYTKTATDNLLVDKLNASNFVTVDNGTFAGLVKSNEVWLIIVQRISTTQTCALVASNYQGTINVKEIVKDSGFDYLTNNQGTINIKYSNSNQGVYGGAYKLK